MARQTPIIAFLTIGLICCFDVINSAATGYFYEHPIRPFNPAPFSTLRSTGPFNSIRIGQKVVTTPRASGTFPSPPSLTPIQATRLPPTPYQRTKFTPITHTIQNNQQVQFQKQPQFQQGQQQHTRQQQVQQQQIQKTQQPQQQYQQFQSFNSQRSQQKSSYPQFPVKTDYTYTRPQQPYPITVQQKVSLDSYPKFITTSTFRPTTKLLPSPTPIPTQRQSTQSTPRPFNFQRPTVPSYTPPPKATTNIPQTPTSIAPTTVASPKSLISNLTQAGYELTSPDVYVIDGRRLKQYKVYEEIDNDINQEAEHFIPGNFFLNNYHNRVDQTHPVTEGLQIESRASRSRFEQNNLQNQRQQQRQSENAIALGSGGLGFVRLPNGNVYLGSGSLGYISNLQRGQDIEDAKTRTGASLPDSLHFGHGPLSGSNYYQ